VQRDGRGGVDLGFEGFEFQLLAHGNFLEGVGDGCSESFAAADHDEKMITGRVAHLQHDRQLAAARQRETGQHHG